MTYGFEWSFSFFFSALVRAPLVFAATAGWGFLSLLVSYADRDGKKQAWMARQWARTLLWIAGSTVEVRGLEKLNTKSHYIFAANHRSYLDTPVVLASIPCDFRFMAKSGLFKIPLMGGHLSRAGHIPVPLDNPREAVRSMNEAGRIIRERKISVLIFPEGGRTMGEMDPFREGAAYIAIKAGIPIVPVGLIRTHELLPMHSVHIRPQRIVVQIGDPIETAPLDIKQRGPLTAELEQRVRALVAEPKPTE